jgi:hypothetical protein
MSEHADKRFEALKSSASQLAQVEQQLKRAQEQHARALEEFLEAAAGSPSQWSFTIKEHDKTIAQGPLSGEARSMFLALRSSFAGAFECPPKEGCVNTGSIGYKCFYLCKTVAFNG